jgi:hypothetical protein
MDARQVDIWTLQTMYDICLYKMAFRANYLQGST